MSYSICYEGGAGSYPVREVTLIDALDFMKECLVSRKRCFLYNQTRTKQIGYVVPLTKGKWVFKIKLGENDND